LTTKRLISREELLGGVGLPARQASVLLFNIESRTAQLVNQSRQAMALFLTEAAVEARNQAFLEAIAQGGNLPVQPSIQDLERFAPQCADLMVDNPVVRAAVAQRLGQKYTFTKAATPGLSAVLGLEQPQVRQAFESLFAKPLETIFATQVEPLEKLRWAWNRLAAWLESRPPFWTAFALVLTETVGAGILALPIALAGVGPLAGIALLLILGLVNVLTIAATAEAVARHGGVRYGHVYFGRLVADYLGTSGSVIFTLALIVLNGLNVLVYYLGLGLTLSDATGLPAVLWVAVIFVIGLYLLSRKTIDSTVASALLVGAVNIVLILVLSGLALSHLQPANLTYFNLPFLGGQRFDVKLIETIFGVVLLAYFGHTSTANCAQVVLRRDGSARSLIKGCVAATLAAMGLYCLWLVAVTGAVAPEVLSKEPGTALAPLAAQFGASVHLFGAVFAALSMGMGSIHTSLGLRYLVQERLPSSLGRGWQFALSVSPVVLIFLVTEALLLTGRESFTKPLSFSGTITATVVGGIFPVLMLVASRRKGDRVPGLVWRGLGHPVVVTFLYLLFLSSLLLHGLFIWQRPLERGAVLLVALLIVGATISMVQRGRFRPRLVLELLVDETEGNRASFGVTAHGQLLQGDVTLGYRSQERPLESGGTIPNFAALERITVQLPETSSRELKVWVHRVTHEGSSESLPASLQVRSGATTQELELGPNEQVVLPLPPGEAQVTISLVNPSSAFASPGGLREKG
jgi:amino acid permease